MKIIIIEGVLGVMIKLVLESIVVEKDWIEEVVLNFNFMQYEFKKDVFIEMVDMEGIFQDILDKFKVLYCCLILV